jgi:hypothetical protein
VISTYFYEDEECRTVTVNSASYTEMLRTFLEQDLQSLGVENQALWFKQDGATAHTASTGMRILNEIFPSRGISRRGMLNDQQSLSISAIASYFSGDI